MYTSGQHYDIVNDMEPRDRMGYYNVQEDINCLTNVEYLPKDYLPSPIKYVENKVSTYIATDGKTIYKTVFVGTFIDEKKDFETPKLNISGFSGCPHFYGKIYHQGKIYEIQQKMTQKFLEDGHKTGGDWVGYKVGEWTQRFIDKQSLENAFELFRNGMQ